MVLVYWLSEKNSPISTNFSYWQYIPFHSTLEFDKIGVESESNNNKQQIREE